MVPFISHISLAKVTVPEEEVIELDEVGVHEEAVLLEEVHEPILTKGYLINGAVVVGTTALQALFNRISNNNDLTSGKTKDNWKAMTNTGLTHVTNKVAKGNYLHVNSVLKQAAVLAAWNAQAVAFDLIAYAVPIPGSTQALPIGLATAGALLNTAGYFSAIGSSAILGKRTYTIFGLENPPAEVPTHINLRRAASSGLVALTAMGASALNRTLVNPNSAFGTIFALAIHDIINKFMKAGQASESKTSSKIILLAMNALAAISSDVLMGYVIPSTIALTSPSRYFGLISTGAGLECLKISAKAALDHDRMPLEDIDPATQAKRARSRTIKGVVGAIMTYAMPILAIATNHSSLPGQSPNASLMIKQVQHALGGLGYQEVFKATSGLWRTAAVVAPGVVALAGDLFANWLDPARASFSATHVVVGSLTSYAGMTLSSYLMGKDDLDD